MYDSMTTCIDIYRLQNVNAIHEQIKFAFEIASKTNLQVASWHWLQQHATTQDSECDLNSHSALDQIQQQLVTGKPDLVMEKHFQLKSLQQW